MSLDPIALGEAAARVTLAQDGRHLRSIRGDGGTPGQVRPALVGHFALDAADTRLLLQALSYPGVSARLGEIGERISVQVHPSLLDHAPAAGMPRPS